VGVNTNVVLLPNAKALLTVPFWLPSAPRPLLAEARTYMLRQAADILARRGAASRPDDPLGHAAIAWRVEALAWSRDPRRIDAARIWHPKSAVDRKQVLLVGRLREEEEFPQQYDACGVSIAERSVIYYDYGICCLEYVFTFQTRAGRDAGDWLMSASFWAHFKATVMDAVEGRTLAVLREPAWANLQSSLVDALILGHTRADEAFPCPLSPNLAQPAWARYLRRMTSRVDYTPQPSLSTGIIPIGKIFGLHRAKNGDQAGVGHVCASFGLNFFLFVEPVDEWPNETDLPPPFRTTVRGVLGGKTIDWTQVNYGARSANLAAIYFGAVHTLSIIAGGGAQDDTAATEAATRSLLRYLWVGYGILTEASRGLMALQGEYFLGYRLPRLRRVKSIQMMIRSLEVARQIAQVLISEFHFSMFWESEIEYDIYHSGYHQWRMPELFAFVQENLDSVVKTSEVLRRGIEDRRQRWMTRLLAGIAALTLITTVKDFFEFSTWAPLPTSADQGWRDVITVAVLVLWVMIGFAVYWLGQEGDKSD
jgi:hypothetical protein